MKAEFNRPVDIKLQLLEATTAWAAKKVARAGFRAERRKQNLKRKHRKGPWGEQRKRYFSYLKCYRCYEIKCKCVQVLKKEFEKEQARLGTEAWYEHLYDIELEIANEAWRKEYLNTGTYERDVDLLAMHEYDYDLENKYDTYKDPEDLFEDDPELNLYQDDIYGYETGFGYFDDEPHNSEW